MDKGKVYIIVGRNHLLNVVGPAGVCRTRAIAEAYAKTQDIDDYKIFEQEMVEEEALQNAEKLMRKHHRKEKVTCHLIHQLK